MIAGFLRWVDVDPRTRPAFDLERATAIVRPLVAAAATARGPRFSDMLAESIQRELMIELGPWIAGSVWVRGWSTSGLFPQAFDPAGGPRTDLADRDDDPVAASTARVVTEIATWQRDLEQLAAVFDAIRIQQPLPEPHGMRFLIERGVEVAASRVLVWVIARTYAEDAWYETFTQVLAWYVESAGYDLGLASTAIDAAISGKFQSWIEPSSAVAEATCADLGRAIGKLADAPPRDATTAWREARKNAFAAIESVVHHPVRADGHLRYIEERDRPRSHDRAEGMLAALELCRDSARRDMTLTFDQMCEWQAAVLGERSVGFRTGPAYAKQGREVYPYTLLTRVHFDEALLEADGIGNLAIRAARVYLDICCFHPFPDGNARAARLALDHVLTRGGFALHVAEPIFIVSRSVDDRQMGASLARVLQRLIGPIG